MEDRTSLNRQLAQMLKGGVIMDVTTPEQARIAEEAGACAVMALERIPADIRAAGGVSRMSDPKMIKGIQEAVSIPVMAKCRIGHFAEAQILQAIEIDYIDESEVLSPADDVYHIDKRQFQVPFVCGAKDLGEALRRINEGATMIRTKGEPGTGDVVQAVRHMRMMQSEIRRLTSLNADELYEASLRNVSTLVSCDLDGDGIVEIPTQPDEAGLLNLSQSRRMDFIVWMDYTSSHPEKSFGLLDEETNCYIELPAEWEGNLKLTDSEEFDGAVELRTVDEDQLVLTVRLARTSANSTGWTRLGVVASRQVQAKMGPDVLLSDTNYRLSKALYLLN